MVNKDTVLDLLRKQKDSMVEQGDPEKRKQEWCNALDQVMKLIARWLEDAQTQELLQVEHYNVTRNEQLVGNYEVPALKVISPNGNTVRIEPKALWIVGANGRVDIERPPRKEMLVRDESGEWHFARLQIDHSGWEYEEFNEQNFWDRLYKVLS